MLSSDDMVPHEERLEKRISTSLTFGATGNKLVVKAEISRGVDMSERESLPSGISEEDPAAWWLREVYTSEKCR